MTRDKIQAEALKLSKSHNNMFLEWVTGLGKTLAALKIINEYEGKWLFIYKETTHLDNHLADVKKHKLNHLLNRIDWTTYHSIHKFTNNEYTGIVLDECHAGITDIRLEKLKEFKNSRILALSATISLNVKTVLQETFGAFYTHKITFNQANDWGILPKPKIILIPLTLDNKVKSETIIINKGLGSEITYGNLEDKFKYLAQKHITVHIKCTEKEKYDYISNLLEYYKSAYINKRQEFMKIKFLQQGSIRKKYLATLKTNVAKITLNKIKDLKYICFAGSTEQALELGGSNVVYSTNKNNAEIIKDFNDNKISNIFAINMLKEGMNLNNIQASLIIQLGSKELEVVQRIGRILRAKESPVQYIIYFKNTQDETYLENVLNLFETEEIN